jgi:hypothetical protein
MQNEDMHDVSASRKRAMIKDHKPICKDLVSQLLHSAQHGSNETSPTLFAYFMSPDGHQADVQNSIGDGINVQRVYPFKAYLLCEAPTGLTFKNFYNMPHYIRMFCIYLTTNSECSPI